MGKKLAHDFARAPTDGPRKRTCQRCGQTQTEEKGRPNVWRPKIGCCFRTDGLKECSVCKLEKTSDEFFNRTSRKTYTSMCKSCSGNYQRDYKKKFQDQHGYGFSQRERLLLKYRVMVQYCRGAPFCQCCKEDRMEFLSIDHIDGGGAEHRKALGGTTIYLWLSKMEYPEGFRVLCHNCNQAIGQHGYCPHHERPANIQPFHDEALQKALALIK